MTDELQDLSVERPDRINDPRDLSNEEPDMIDNLYDLSKERHDMIDHLQGLSLKELSVASLRSGHWSLVIGHLYQCGCMSVCLHGCMD